MSLNEVIRNTCKKLGENNKPTYVVMAIAAVKGICRPLFTMMDKTEKPETKKYTALREGLTEVIAIPAYWSCGELAGNLAKRFYKDKVLAKRAETNFMFVGVCAAALFVIPGLCSAVIKPVMDKLGFKPVEEKFQKENVQTAVWTQPQKAVNPQKIFSPRMSTFVTRPQTGLRVGGL